MTPEEKQLAKARFFGQHIGCYVQVNRSLLLHDGVYELSSVEWLDHGICLYFRGETSNAWAIDGICKLMLRQISSITDEEAIDVLTRATGLYIVEIKRDDDKIVGVGMGRGNGNIISGGGNVAMWIKTSPLPIGRFLETWSSVKGVESPEYMDYIAVDYLRSKGFCLPFCGLDPVKEGWAIIKE